MRIQDVVNESTRPALEHLDRDARYDAFVSHAHADKATVTQLVATLRDAWVPGRKRRRIFYDTTSLSAGELTPAIRSALHASRYLVVCVSQAAADSRWVRQEIATFLERRPPSRIVFCTVADPSLRIKLFAEYELGKPGDYLRPDLSGHQLREGDRAARRAAQRAFELAALGVLAPIVGLPDKASLTDERARAWRRRRLGVTVLGLLGLVATGARLWWERTPAGAVSVALAKNRAHTEVVDEIRSLVRAAVALGRIGRAEDVDVAARIVGGREMGALVTAAGLAALPEPDCARVQTAVAEAGAHFATSLAEPYLWASSRCQIGDARRIVDVTELDAGLRTEAAVRLAETGHNALAVEIMLGLSPNDAVRVVIAIDLARRGTPPLSEDSAQRAVDRVSSVDRLLVFAEALADYDRMGRLRDPLARAIAANMVEQLDDDTLGLAHDHQRFDLEQRLAAALAAQGKRDTATALLSHPMPDDKQARRAGLMLVRPYAARGLALHRLGRPDEGDRWLARAEEQTRIVTASSDGGLALLDLAEIDAMMGRWADAFARIEGANTARARVLFRYRLVELWAMRQALEEPPRAD